MAPPEFPVAMFAARRKIFRHNSLGLTALAALTLGGLPTAVLAQSQTVAAAPVAAAWTPASAAALATALRHADAHGLDASDLARAVEAAGPGDATRLNRIALTYARALALGMVDPRRLNVVFSLETNRRPLDAELAQALREDRLGPWLASLAPQDDDYRTLSEAYLQARAAAGRHPGSKALDLKARTLALNLERRRWLARGAAPTRIDVNVAATRLWFFKDGILLDSRKVVAGAPGHETPLLQASFRRIVTNPGWTVPPDIAKREILPKGAGYMARHDMRLVNGRVVQDPGPDSALGRVKFDLNDDQAIYLHDTPVQAAFDRSNRNLSHGCIRVEDAVGFARIVADAFGAADRFDDRLATGETGSVSLGADVPVRLVYETAYVDQGEVRFAADHYGWDAKLADALGMSASDAVVAAPLRDDA
ncbi:MAG: murein L,D-transpeptidase [Phenylobacterium sp.]|nr:MAG: murein L,D-transpeptidase [Phenylobacterium sp.]